MTNYCNALLLFILFQHSSYGQASLAAEDTIANITVPSAPEETFTVVRDARISKQWYYFANRPRLSEIRQPNGGTKPEFTLLKYQYRNPENSAALLEGGLLQFSATLDLPPQTLIELKSALVAELSKAGTTPGEVRLASLPLKSATVQIYAPGGEAMTATTFGTGNAPVVSSQKMIFSLDLTKLGANVYTGLTAAGQTGIPVALTLTYSGITPPTGFRITVDWDQTHKHYSTHKDFRARASYFGLFGGSAAVDRKKISNELIQNNCIKVEITNSESSSADALLEKHLEGILARINREIEVVLTPPTTIQPAKASKPNTSGYFAGAGYSVAMKSSTNKKLGKETIDFTQRQIVDRVTTCGGFIGIGSYPESVRNELVTISAPDSFTAAYLLLPTVLHDQSLNIESASLEFSLLDATDTEIDRRAFQWNGVARGWASHPQNSEAPPATLASFPLAAYNKETLANLKIRSVLQLTQAGFNTETIDNISPATNGQRAFYSLPDAGHLVVFDGSAINWAKFGGDVVKVEVRLQSADGKNRTGTLTPTFQGGNWGPPTPYPFIVPRKGNPVIIPTVSLTLKDGTTKVWRYNNVDILTNQTLNARRVILLDTDF